MSHARLTCEFGVTPCENGPKSLFWRRLEDVSAVWSELDTLGSKPRPLAHLEQLSDRATERFRDDLGTQLLQRSYYIRGHMSLNYCTKKQLAQ